MVEGVQQGPVLVGTFFRHHQPHRPMCHLQRPHHHHHQSGCPTVRPGYITPPSPRDSTLTIRITNNSTARYVTSSTLAIANRTTILTVSITNSARSAIPTNTTSDTIAG